MYSNLTHGHMPCMKFLFVRPDVCRRLPSDSTSRWTPLPWAMRFPLLGLARDLHPLANAHAERTTEHVRIPVILTCFFEGSTSATPTLLLHPFSALQKHPGSTAQNFCKPLHPRRCVRMAKMQGAEDEGAESILKYMTKPESDSNAADWLL